ncbi:MAG: AraC family transcriptional regulator ligand-binding domain-containing protein, partial [Myxococcales bacterium]|nr:AraC family transcriptional regulator ligand-binding domain-containing protein [Myxococcales bacterium]
LSIVAMSLGDLRPRPKVAIVPAGPYERVVARLEGLGHDRAALLKRAGIAPDELGKPRAMLTLDQVEALALAGVAIVDRPGYMLDAGATLLFPSYGNVGLAALTAPTLHEAINVAERYLELVTPLFVLEQGGNDDTLWVRVSARYRLHPDAHRVHFEFVLSALYTLARNGVGRVPAGVRLALPTMSERLSAWLEERGVAPRTSDDGDAVLEVPRALAGASFVMADAAAHAGFVALCEADMQELETNDPMTRAVREALNAGGPPFPSLDVVCCRLGATPRTLRRRLSEEGTGYQELLDEARFSWAKRALQHSRRPVTQIAYDLGYSAPSNFTRAFRRALGTSPSAFRSGEPDL